MILHLTLILLPLLWLAVAALVVAACRSAKRADRLTAGQRGRRIGDPSAYATSASYGFVSR